MSIRGALDGGCTQPAIHLTGALLPTNGPTRGAISSENDIDFILLELGNQNKVLLEITGVVIKENTAEGDIDG